jgi:hypothetical protein
MELALMVQSQKEKELDAEHERKMDFMRFGHQEN